MSDDRKPSEDLKEGLSLLFRAARGVAKQVDVSKIDKTLDKALTEVVRVAGTVGRVVGDEINRVSAKPPWADKPTEDPKPSEASAGEEKPQEDAKAEQEPSHAAPNEPENKA
jgi:hypothetical protein